MQIFTSRLFCLYAKKVHLFCMFLFSYYFSNAQLRDYGMIYSGKIRGSAVLCGNTLMAVYNSDNATVNTAEMNDNLADGNSVYGNDGSNMRFVDVDGNSGEGAVTKNSSTADLSYPSTGIIKLARLYWGGRADTVDFDLNLPLNRTIKIRKGTAGSYNTLEAIRIDDSPSTDSTGFQYQAYADITNIIQDNGPGTYSVGDAALSQGAVFGGGYYGGWCIVIVYEDPIQTYFNSVRIYDGFQRTYNDGLPANTSATLTGLDVRPGTLALTDAQIGVMCWEGDANISGDSLNINNSPFNNAVNGTDNPWNGTISNNGSPVHSKSPDYSNQMGIDIDQFYAGEGYGIKGGDASVDLRFSTVGDQYFPGLFTFVIKSTTPFITLDKSVTDANGDHIAGAGEILTYKIKGKNINTGNGNKTLLSDTLQDAVTYVEGSMRVNYCPGVLTGSKTDITDADIADTVHGTTKILRFHLGYGADGSNGGILTPNDSFEVQFQVSVNEPCNGIIPPIINTANVVTFSDANEVFTSEATAIIAPEEGPLPVRITRFEGNISGLNSSVLQWTTASEYNSNRFEIQRSTDGKSFTTVIAIPSGLTAIFNQNYSVTDNLSGVHSPIIFYRVREVDIDGRYQYSGTIMLRRAAENTGFIAFPNPFDKDLHCIIQWNRNEAADLLLYTMSGQVVLSKPILLVKGSNLISLDKLPALPAGSYLFELHSYNIRLSKKIVHQ